MRALGQHPVNRADSSTTKSSVGKATEQPCSWRDRMGPCAYPEHVDILQVNWDSRKARILPSICARSQWTLDLIA